MLTIEEHITFICTLSNEKLVGLMEKGGNPQCFGPGSNPRGCRILGFFGLKKKTRKIGEIAEKSVKTRKIAEKSAISPKIARNFIKSTIGGGYRVDLHR